DIRDYTSLAERMTPEENYRFVNAYNGRMGPIIQKNKGFVNQYLGDAIMSIFTESPADALKAAIEMQQTLQVYNSERKEKGRAPIRIGAGLHTGSLIMGIIGDRKRMDAATISDTVNTASRIENLTKHYGASILVSENSLEKIADREDFHLRFLGKVVVKGKQEAIGVYECFSGDQPESLERKLETLPLFEEGLENYLAGDFQEAMKAFEEVLRRNQNDAAAQLFLNRIAYYLTHGKPKEWSGVEFMDDK
ncbi:MAG: adenylate/guanylate cyclase domain-containing protein, partial [Phaeodactylibacter sp.]|nr:adenylate/guanylate cyclase domain-containing protein [Phaeodactylibacter sp.]